MPKNEKTAVYNVRLDIRALAVIHAHYESQGVKLPSISSLTRQAMEGLSNILVAQMSSRDFPSTTEAALYLDSKGLMGPLKTRGNRALSRAMAQESLALEGLNPEYSKIKGAPDPDQYAAARKILQQKESDKSGAILGPVPGSIKES